MSEEIIIDGVDVAGCKYRVCHYVEDEDVEMNNCCCLTYTPCNYEKKDCYYKQLKRLQAENERLKKEIITLEYKLDAEKPSMIIPKPKQLAVPIEEVEKYIKALEEIRDMFDNCCFKANFLNNCDSDCKYIDECDGELSVIRSKIKEVIGEK